MPNHLTLTVSGCKRQDLLCGHSNHDIFTCEDIKISCFRAKVHLVFLTNGKRLSVYYLTNRFHVAVRLFSNRSQMTSKYRKNKEVAHEPQASVSLLFLPHFEVVYDLLLNRPTVTWNLFVLYNDQKRKRPIHIPASNRLTF